MFPASFAPASTLTCHTLHLHPCQLTLAPYHAFSPQVGTYLDTIPIYQFTMPCPYCNNHIIIRTDPQHDTYTCINGAQRRSTGDDDKFYNRSHDDIEEGDKYVDAVAAAKANLDKNDPLSRLALQEAIKRKAIEDERLLQLMYDRQVKENGLLDAYVRIDQRTGPMTEGTKAIGLSPSSQMSPTISTNQWSDDVSLLNTMRARNRQKRQKEEENRANLRRQIREKGIGIELLPSTSEEAHLAQAIVTSRRHLTRQNLSTAPATAAVAAVGLNERSIRINDILSGQPHPTADPASISTSNSDSTAVSISSVPMTSLSSSSSFPTANVKQEHVVANIGTLSGTNASTSTETNATSAHNAIAVSTDSGNAIVVNTDEVIVGPLQPSLADSSGEQLDGAAKSSAKRPDVVKRTVKIVRGQITRKNEKNSTASHALVGRTVNPSQDTRENVFTGINNQGTLTTDISLHPATSAEAPVPENRGMVAGRTSLVAYSDSDNDESS